MDEPANETLTPLSGSTETRKRLLQAAGEVFAEQGYRRATVRDICSRADANVAAINYHFGDKERLYRTVLGHGLSVALQKYPPDMGVAAGAPAEVRLLAYIRSLLHRLLGEGAPAWHGKLMSREMIDPTGALDSVVQETIRPLSQHLAQIIREIVGPAAGADPNLVQRSVFSIVGQCLFYHQAAPVVSKIEGTAATVSIGVEKIEKLADHVHRFSLAALRGLSQEPAHNKPAAS
jgi:AcrR family transcriptional regulator